MAKLRRRRKRRMGENLPALSARRRRGGAVARRKGGAVRRKRRGLSELFTPQTAMESGRTTISGLFGGGISGVLNDVIPDNTRFGWRLGYNLLGSFLMTSVLRAPKMGAGMAGAAGLLLYQKMREGNLQENYDYANPNVLSEYPLFADANGNAMMLADDGEMYYLDEDGYVDPAMELSQGFMNDDRSGAAIYPAYVNPSDY